jgi:hypothetical protein
MKNKIITFGLLLVVLLSLIIGIASALSNSGGGPWSYYDEITLKGNLDTGLSPILIIITFALIGFGLKYIDDAFDEEQFSKGVAMLMAPILVVIWAGISIFDSISATILFSILFAVILSGKVDNLTFKLSSIALIAILFSTQILHLSWIPFFALTVMGLVDEKGNDYVDSHETDELGDFFFAHRCGMKLGTLGLCMISLLPWLYLIAFLAFDTAYEFVKIRRYLTVPHLRPRVEKFQLAIIVLNHINR